VKKRKRGDDQHDRERAAQQSEIERALEREAEAASRHQIRLSLLIAAILRDKDGAKRARDLLTKLNEKGYILFAPVVQVAEYFN